MLLAILDHLKISHIDTNETQNKLNVKRSEEKFLMRPWKQKVY